MTPNSAGKSTKWHRSWPRLLIVALLGLLLLGLAVWWQRAILGHWLLQQSLTHTALTAPTLSGLSFDFKRAKLAEISFDLAIPASDLSVALKDVETDYDLAKQIVNTVSIGHAKLKFNHHPAGKAETKNATATPISLPLNRLSIAKLDIDIDTPWGLSRFTGQADIARGGEAIEAKFQDSEQSIRLEIKRDFSAANLRVERLPSGEIFEINAKQLDQPAKQINLNANALALIEWFSSSLLIPDVLKAKTQTTDLSKMSPLLSAMQLSANAQTPDNFSTLQAKALLTRDKRSLLAIDLSMANNQTVDAVGRLDMAATDAFELIKPWLPAMASSWTLSNGKVQGNFNLHKPVRQESSGTARLNISALTLTAGTARIENGNIAINIPELAERAMDLSAEVPILGLGKELVASDLNVKARYLDRELTLNRASLAIFGGEIALTPGRIDFGTTPMLLTLRLHDVDLSQLLDSLHYPHISGTGGIDGELPLQISAGAIDLQEGTLNGTRPGVLRYTGPADSENIAFKALRNLVYQNLQATVNYRPNGDYRLGLRLEGSNPEVLSGHALAFNLNISGQLPELLQKGMLAGDFEKTVLEQATAKPADAKTSSKPPSPP